MISSRFIIDLAAVVLFAVIGVHNHEHSWSLHEILIVAAPFVLGLIIFWGLWLAATGREYKADPAPTTLGRVKRWFSGVDGQTRYSGAPLGVFTGVSSSFIGMALRAIIFRGSTSPQFIVMGTIFLTSFIIIGRLAYYGIARLRNKLAHKGGAASDEDVVAETVEPIS